MQGRGIIDSVSHVTDHLAALLERQDDALFLIGIDLRKDLCGLRADPQCFVAEIVQLGAREDFIGAQSYRLGQVNIDRSAVCGNQLQRDSQAR